MLQPGINNGGRRDDDSNHPVAALLPADENALLGLNNSFMATYGMMDIDPTPTLPQLAAPTLQAPPEPSAWSTNMSLLAHA